MTRSSTPSCPTFSFLIKTGCNSAPDIHPEKYRPPPPLLLPDLYPHSRLPHAFKMFKRGGTIEGSHLLPGSRRPLVNRRPSFTVPPPPESFSPPESLYSLAANNPIARHCAPLPRRPSTCPSWRIPSTSFDFPSKISLDLWFARSLSNPCNFPHLGEVPPSSASFKVEHPP